MKRFLFAFLVFPCLSFAQDFTVQKIDMGIITTGIGLAQCNHTLKTDGTHSTSGSWLCNIGTIDAAGYEVGIIHYANSGGQTAQVTTDSTTTLTCVDCSSSATIAFSTPLVSPTSLNRDGDFKFGGTIAVASGQTAGLYRGILNVRIQIGSNYENISLPIQVTIRGGTSIPSIVPVSDQDLSFGKIAAGRAYSVTVGTDGTRTSTDPSVLLPGGTVQQGIFTLNNTSNRSANVTSVTMNTNVTLSNGTDSISLTLTTSPALSSIKSVPANTKYPVNVGGTLQMTGNESGGTYSGTYNITVNN